MRRRFILQTQQPQQNKQVKSSLPDNVQNLINKPSNVQNLINKPSNVQNLINKPSNLPNLDKILQKPIDIQELNFGVKRQNPVPVQKNMLLNQNTINIPKAQQFQNNTNLPSEVVKAALKLNIDIRNKSLAEVMAELSQAVLKLK